MTDVLEDVWSLYWDAEGYDEAPERPGPSVGEVVDQGVDQMTMGKPMAYKNMAQMAKDLVHRYYMHAHTNLFQDESVYPHICRMKTLTYKTQTLIHLFVKSGMRSFKRFRRNTSGL